MYKGPEGYWGDLVGPGVGRHIGTFPTWFQGPYKRRRDWGSSLNLGPRSLCIVLTFISDWLNLSNLIPKSDRGNRLGSRFRLENVSVKYRTLPRQLKRVNYCRVGLTTIGIGSHILRSSTKSLSFLNDPRVNRKDFSGDVTVPSFWGGVVTGVVDQTPISSGCTTIILKKPFHDREVSKWRLT